MSDVNDDMAFRECMGTPSGRAVLWMVLEQCAVHAASWDGVDVNRALVREGQRKVGMWVMGQMARLDPNGDLKRLMELESLERDRILREKNAMPLDSDEVI